MTDSADAETPHELLEQWRERKQVAEENGLPADAACLRECIEELEAVID